MTMTDERTETITESESDYAGYKLTVTQAKQLAALHFVASKDQTRPVLTCINLEWSADSLQGTVTDSYKLAERKFNSSDNIDEAKKDRLETSVYRETVSGKGSVLVNALGFRDAIAQAVKLSRNARDDMPVIGLELTEDTCKVTAGLPSEGMSFSVQTVDATFPNTARLWEDQPETMGDTVGKLSFSATHFWDIARAQGKTPARMDKPIVICAETDLRPIAVRFSGDIGFRALLMPVRL